MQASDSNPPNTPDRESMQNLNRALEKHFPQPVEETRLVLMDVSPHRLHAYWHITPWELESTRARLGDADLKLILRFHDQTGKTSQETAPSFDIEIAAPSGNQYVELWEDARSYSAELGLLTKTGKLIDLTRSNTVELPKAGHSARHGSQVLTLTPLADTLYEQPPGSDSAAGISPRKSRQTWQADSNQLNDATLQQGLTKLFPLFPDPGAPVFEARTLELEFPAGQPPLMGLPAQKIELPPPAGKRSSVSPVRAAQTRDSGLLDSFPLCSIADAEAFAKQPLVPLIPLDSLQAAAAQVPAGFAFPPLVSRQQSTFPPPGIISGNTALSGPPVSSHPLSSFSLLDSPEEELHIELHIHGRAQPHSHFVLHGQPIATQADGSFSLHKKLPPETRRLVAQLLTGIHSREE